MKEKNEMTCYERVMAALQGKKPDRTSLFPLVSNRAIRKAGFKVSEIIEDAAFRS